MNSARTAFFTFLIAGVAWMPALRAFAADVQYISPLEQSELEKLFQEARFSPAQDSLTLTNTGWTCAMYGVRSHLQVQRDLKLYKWAIVDGAKNWINEGAQPVSAYRVEANALVGRKDRFEDQVKITKDGRLISRLSLTTPAKTVLAFSLCSLP